MLAATPAAKRTLKNHENHCVSRWICLGALFAPSAKRTNFRAPAHEKLREKQVKKQPPRRAEKCFKKHRSWLQKWLQNHSKIVPGRPKRHKETPRASQERPKATKSAPRAPQERPKSDFTEKKSPGGSVSDPRPRAHPPLDSPYNPLKEIIILGT